MATKRAPVDGAELCQLKILQNISDQVSVDKIHGGDRAGICVTQFDPKLLERGLVRPKNNHYHQNRINKKYPSSLF